MDKAFFKDKVIIITGASSGIGLASARLFGSFGANVVMAARHLDVLEKEAPSVNADPGKVLCVRTDVSVEQDCRNLVEQTVAKYKILQRAKLYRSIMAIAVPETPQNRIVAAQAADELLNVAGVDASMVMYPTEDGGVFVSARSIGDVNVQLIMEKLGGGGNRAAAAAQINGLTLKQAVEKLYAAIDEYIDS